MPLVVILWNHFFIFVVMKALLYSSLFLVLVQESVFSQTESNTSIKQLPAISIGSGALVYDGEIGKGNGIVGYGRINVGYNLGIEQNFNNTFGLALNGIYGKLSANERSLTRNLNFESPIFQTDLNLVFHFDNGKMINQSSSIGPYLSVGLGYLKFDPHGDVTDKNGNKFYYWKDGSIRNLPEIPSNYPNAVILQRDYTYKTRLTDSTNNYKRHTLSLPLGGGIRFKLTDHLNAGIAAVYYICFSDYIDNFKLSGFDKYFYSSVSIQYNFSHERPVMDDSQFNTVDFSAIDNQDSDGDGVKDSQDKCQNTPKGVKVDQKGCPLDADKDGVPDYLDKEPNSKKGPVDANGISLTDTLIFQRNVEWNAEATERSEIFNENPSLKLLQDLDAKKLSAFKKQEGKTTYANLPPKYKEVDQNQDGYISSGEIRTILDAFFEGETDFTVEKLEELINYFFEQ